MLTGISIEKEYVCLANPGLEEPLTVYLTGHDDSFFNVTECHLFLGYKPVIIGLYATAHSEKDAWLHANNEICLSFMDGRSFLPHSTGSNLKTDRRALATMTMKKFKAGAFLGGVLYFYEGVCAEHHFISKFHQSLNTARRRMAKTKAGNIDLDPNRYNQVRVAYAVPRKISLITLGDGTLMNMFPTDLHGEVNSEFYVSSLRHGGRANEQVKALKRIVLSDIASDCYNVAYSMGSNHMRPLTLFEKFPLQTARSQMFSLPLPEGVVAYTELEQIEFFEKGIHCVHLYQIRNKVAVAQNNVLMHIHQFYAQWQMTYNKKSDFLYPGK